MVCSLTTDSDIPESGWGGWRGDLTIIPKLLLYCGQIKVVFMLGCWICAWHIGVEKDTQMQYESLSIIG